jgi:hypothetical protein
VRYRDMLNAPFYGRPKEEGTDLPGGFIEVTGDIR